MTAEYEVTAESLIIPVRDLPDVDGLDRIPHIHVKDSNGETGIFQVLPGDTAQELYRHAQAYLALALALQGTGHGWEQPYELPPGVQPYSEEDEDVHVVVLDLDQPAPDLQP